MTDYSVALVFTGGDAVPPAVLRSLPREAFVVAADSGLIHALADERRVDLAIGDFDSAPSHLVDRAAAAGTRIVRHPVAKDKTDLALGMDAAAAAGAERIIVVGGSGGRLDHHLGNVFVLADPHYAALEVEARMGPATLTVVRRTVSLHGRPGDYVSLFTLGEPATGITTTGLRFPLAGETLPAATSRGISNEFVEPRAMVSVAGGVLVAVQPGPDDP